MTEDTKRLLGTALKEIVDAACAAERGDTGPRVRIGLLASGSELGPEELLRGALLAQESSPVQVVMIGPRSSGEGAKELLWIETPDCEEDISRAMEKALGEGEIEGCVALHYPFPLGVTTIGKVLTPARGKGMFLASTTGTASANRVEAMLRNTFYGIATAKASGIADPTVGILNVEGAQTVFKALKKLQERGYALTFGSSVRRDGGAILRGNDILAGAVDVCVADSLTGNVLMKMFSAFTTGGGYEATGWGYGPSCGEGWNRIVSIISRASGAPVIAEAVALTARTVRGELPRLVQEELRSARKAGLDAILEELAVRAQGVGEPVVSPPAEPTDEEIHGLDVLSIEEAVRELWKAGIYAESAMGCTGPVVKIPGRHKETAEELLRRGGYC
jgi:betaine reductase